MEANDLLTLAAVAELLHCSKAHIANVVAGRVRGCRPIPAVSLGRRRLVRRVSLDEWIAANENTIPASLARGAGTSQLGVPENANDGEFNEGKNV